jgi:hypothetical protein
MGTKICTKCKVEKPLNDYYKHKNGKDGLNPVCKPCWKEETKSFEKNNPRYEYRKERYEKIKQYHIEYCVKRKKVKYHSDYNFKLLQNIRSRINHALKENIKSKNTKDLIGCDITEYKQYLELLFKNGMFWENHGKIWEIDHIIPCASFDLLDPIQQQQCFHYTNTQPLFKTSGLARQFGYIHDEGNRNKSSKIVDKNDSIF